MSLFKKSDKKAKKENPVQGAEAKERKIYIPDAGATIVSKSILNGERPLKWFFRQEAGGGNGWIAFGDGDDEAYVNNVDNMKIVDFNTLANIEPAVADVFYLPYGADLELRADAKGKYFVDTKTGKEFREPVEKPAHDPAQDAAMKKMRAAFEKNLKFLNQKDYPVEWMQGLFRKSEGMRPYVIGVTDCPSGVLTAADPLAYAYLGNEKCAPILNRTVPAGAYPVELAILDSSLVGRRYAAARLKISDKEVRKYEVAMPKGYTIEQYGTVFNLFGVDTGLACFCDVKVANEYLDFRAQFAKEHPKANIYDDYFKAVFADSYAKDSENTQRPEGDYICWTVPDTDHRLIMFASGLGDGAYSAYWGLDEEGEVAELVIPFLNPDFFR